MPSAAELIEKYRQTQAGLTEYERAVLEREVYDQATLEGLRTGKEFRAAYLARVLGGSRYNYENRFALLKAPAILWDRVDKEQMLVRSAVEIHRRALQASFNGSIPYHQALKAILAEYDAGAPTVLASGKVFRKGLKPREKDVRPSKVKEVKAKPDPKASVPSPNSARGTWHAIRQAMVQMLNERLSECDETFANSIREEFLLELQALCTVYQNRIQRVAATARGTRRDAPSMALDDVNEALMTLSHDPIGRLGDHVDSNQLKKSYRNLVKRYHPDQNGGNDVLRRNFEAVQQAHRLIEDYVSLYGENQYAS